MDAGELAASDELLEGQHAIKVDIKVSECPPIVLEFFLDSLMDLPQNILDMLSLLLGVGLEHCRLDWTRRLF